MRTGFRLDRWALGLSLAAAACSSGAGRNDAASANPGWPAEHPRVRFLQSFETTADLGDGPGILDRITGRPAAALFERPHAVAWAGGDLVVTDPGAGRVVLLRADGSSLASEPGGLESPVGVAACGERIFVADSATGRIAEFDRSLRKPKTFASGLERPTALACRPGGGLAVAETGAQQIVVIGDDGTRKVLGSRGTAPGEFNFPTTLAADGDSLWVGDTMNFRVQQIGWDATPRRQFGEIGDASGQMPRVKGIAVDRQGNLWISDAWLDSVSLWSRDGSYLLTIGRGGSGPGEFRFPAGVAVNARGEVAVVDALNRRVQLFEPIPQSPMEKTNELH